MLTSKRNARFPNTHIFQMYSLQDCWFPDVLWKRVRIRALTRTKSGSTDRIAAAWREHINDDTHPNVLLARA